MLHHLLAQDRRFSFPNAYQVSFPHQFLTREAKELPRFSFFIPRRRPMDNVELNLVLPQEDEFALSVASLKSPCLGWVFPRHRERFEKYLTFKEASPEEIAEWQDAFLRFVSKLQWRDNRPLILKSPPHTARIRLLLEMFPQAKFVHIHRNPHAVFQSSRKTFQIMYDWHGLHEPQLQDLDDWILRQYREMYASYFEERALIPRGHLHEVQFETLEKNPLDEMRRLYNALELPDIETAEPDLRRYIGLHSHYEKNSFVQLSSELKVRIEQEWKTCFEEWNYPIG